MAKKVIGIHLVCHNNLNVKDLGNGYFHTGHWKISENSANTAQYIALHNTKNEPSYKQGVIQFWVPSEETGRIIFYVKTTDEPMQWEGDGTGEKGFLWSEE